LLCQTYSNLKSLFDMVKVVYSSRNLHFAIRSLKFLIFSRSICSQVIHLILNTVDDSCYLFQGVNVSYISAQSSRPLILDDVVVAAALFLPLL
jgi:hypothetical protein